MRGRSRWTLLLVSAITVAVAASAIADAATVRHVRTRITIASVDRQGAQGKVKSKQTACRAHRKVRLLIEPQGGGGERPGGGPLPAKPVGSATTAADGSWRIDAQLSPGRSYFAEAVSKRIGIQACAYAVTTDVSPAA